MPHITEEIYQVLYGEREEHASIHLSKWPNINTKYIDDQAEKNGDIITTLISEIRREKAEKHLPLNAPIKKLTIFTEKNMARIVTDSKEDICGTCKVNELQFSEGKGNGREVKPYDISFTADYK
jgi:valyl-tRNA synthetase